MAYPFDDQTIGCYQNLPALECPASALNCRCGRIGPIDAYMGSTTDAYGHKICFFCKIYYCWSPCPNRCWGPADPVIIT